MARARKPKPPPQMPPSVPPMPPGAKHGPGGGYVVGRIHYLEVGQRPNPRSKFIQVEGGTDDGPQPDPETGLYHCEMCDGPVEGPVERQGSGPVCGECLEQRRWEKELGYPMLKDPEPPERKP